LATGGKVTEHSAGKLAALVMGHLAAALVAGRGRSEISEISEKRGVDVDANTTFARLSRFFRILRELERRSTCQLLVSVIGVFDGDIRVI
jgi:hypothetical protein